MGSHSVVAYGDLRNIFTYIPLLVVELKWRAGRLLSCIMSLVIRVRVDNLTAEFLNKGDIFTHLSP